MQQQQCGASPKLRLLDHHASCNRNIFPEDPCMTLHFTSCLVDMDVCVGRLLGVGADAFGTPMWIGMPVKPL